jgi:hypothetical protein
MGGYMALRTAARESRVTALVLGGIGDAAPDPQDREAVAQALEADEVADLPRGEPRSIREYADATNADRLALAAIQRGRSSDPFPFDVVTAPALVIAGKDDELAVDVGALVGALPHATLVLVPGDHASALIEPAFSDAIVSFLRSAPR